MKKIAADKNYQSEEDLINQFLAGGGKIDRFEEARNTAELERDEIDSLPSEARRIRDMLITLTSVKMNISKEEAAELVETSNYIMPETQVSPNRNYPRDEWGRIEEKDRVMWKITVPVGAPHRNMHGKALGEGYPLKFTYNKTTRTWFNTTGGSTGGSKKERQLVELIQKNIDNTEDPYWNRDLDRGKWKRDGTRSLNPRYKPASQEFGAKKIAAEKNYRIAKAKLSAA